MAIRRPKKPEEGSTNQAESSGPKVDLVEQLVEKSLKINPKLREQGRNARELAQRVQADLTREKAKPQAPEEAPSTASTDTKTHSIVFFVEQKAKALAEARVEMAAKRRALEAEEKALQDRSMAEVADFVGLLCPEGSPSKDPAVKEAHKAGKAYFEELGLSLAELDRRSRAKGAGNK